MARRAKPCSTRGVEGFAACITPAIDAGPEHVEVAGSDGLVEVIGYGCGSRPATIPRAFCEGVMVLPYAVTTKRR
jgi:hypothetical protein